MISAEEQKKLDNELFTECRGYGIRDDKPDGVYIKEIERFFDVNKIKRLIEEGADVNVKDNDGRSPLHYVGSAVAAKLLIEAGADVNAKDNYEDSPLHQAVNKGNADLVKLLIEEGADVNAKGFAGRTPLHIVRHTAIAKLLVEAGADVDAKDGTDNTPLHDVGNKQIAKVLIDAGANINAKNKFDKSPLIHALKDERASLASFLIESGAKVSLSSVLQIAFPEIHNVMIKHKAITKK